MSSRIEELKELGWDVNAIAELLDELKCELGDITGTTAPQPSETPSLEVRIVNTLKKMGMPFHIKGRDYVKEAITYCIENHCTVAEISVTKELYPAVAKRYKTTASRVERAIRHACERTIDNCSPDLEKVLGCTMSPNKGKPTNSEFISMLVDYIILGEDLK